MHKIRLLIAAAAAAVSGFGVSWAMAGEHEAGGDARRAYYRSQGDADRRLAEFGVENPRCPLWTNWQKTCSRTGEGGAVFCATDRARPARPSEPFCVNSDFYRASGPLSQRQRASSLRFCVATRPRRIVDGAGNLLFEDVVCSRYSVDRPFNGRRAGARVHPLCGQWSRGPRGVLVCSEWRESACRLEDGVPRPPEGRMENRISISRPFDPEAISAFGVLCPS